MKIRRSAVGLFAIAALGLVSACGTTDGTGTDGPSATPTLSPVEQLKASTKDIASTSHKVKANNTEQEVSASSDPATNVSSFGAAFEDEGTKFTIDFLVIGNERYLKVVGLSLLGIDDKKWMRFDMAKVKDPSKGGPKDPKDPAGLKLFTDAILTAESTGDRSYKGTFDAGKAKDAGGLFDPDAIGGLGDKAKSVPFEATLDDKGRLSTLKIMLPAHDTIEENTINATVSGYGSTTLAKPAAADVTEAPETVYQFLDS